MRLDYVSYLEVKGVAGSYVKSALKAVKSWLSHNGIEVRRKIKIRWADDTPTLKEARVPTRQELRRIFLSADKKVRAICALVAHSGIRLMTLGNYRGTDDLRISDLPEMRIENDIVEFGRFPTMIIVRP